MQLLSSKARDKVFTVMESKKRSEGVFFQMPLHYPRYTKEDYQNMPEWKLDRLLAEYGLSTRGDLAYKREFAMGAFLWPDFHHHQEPSSYSGCKGSSLYQKKIK